METKPFLGLDWKRMLTHVSLYISIHERQQFMWVDGHYVRNYVWRNAKADDMCNSIDVDKCWMHWNFVIPGGDWWSTVAVHRSWKHETGNQRSFQMVMHLYRFIPVHSTGASLIAVFCFVGLCRIDCINYCWPFRISYSTIKVTVTNAVIIYFKKNVKFYWFGRRTYSYYVFSIYFSKVRLLFIFNGLKCSNI